MVRVVFANAEGDRFWYFIGMSSVAAALYLWVLSIFYVPGPAVLILTATFTGILFAADQQLLSSRVRTLVFSNNRKIGSAMVVAVSLLIIGSVSSMYVVAQQFSGTWQFNSAIAKAADGGELEQAVREISGAFGTTNNDRFVREFYSCASCKWDHCST